MIYLLFIPLLVTPIPRSGIAVSSTGNFDYEQLTFSYYHNWTLSFDERQGMTAVPYLACNYPYWPGDPGVNWLEFFELKLAEYQQENGRPYDGILLWLNEPDREGQCYITPEEAAIFYQQTRERCPDCQMTMPNISHHGLTWLNEFLALDSFNFAYGAYHTYLSGDPAVFDNQYKELLASYGYDLPVIVSEWGNCSHIQAMTMRRFFEANTYLHFYYTDHFGSCLDLFNEFGDLTPMGELFNEQNEILVNPE